MKKSLFKQIRNFTIFIMVIFAHTASFAQTIGVFYDSGIEQFKFAAGDIKTALESKGHTAEMLALSSLNASYVNKKIVIALASDSAVISLLTNQGGIIPVGLGQQAYGLQTTSNTQKSFWVLGGDINGAMYGGLQLAENITFDGLSGNYDEKVSPDFIQRGVKLNLALDRRIPTYSGYMANTSTQHAITHVWDMKFWETWFDQQARNRYNVISVWVHHPFPALVKVPGYEKACLPGIEGYFGFANSSLTHEQRVAYWRQVMTYAHNRGFSFYFFCWNVCVDYAKDMYPAITDSESNTTTLDYLSKSMKALLETYPELDGFGISAGDNMDLPKDSRGPWTWKAYGKAAYDYALLNPDRKFTMIHRGLGAGILKLYEDWGPLTNLPNMKFDYSVKYANAHMFSTLTTRWYEADMSDAAAGGQKTWLTLRNDDFLYMDMGDPEFVRGFLKGIPYRQVINSFYIGSDIYHPTCTYWCKDNTMNGQLEIQRNWYIQMLWGRTAYNKNISDNVFKNYMANRFPQVSSETLFNAWALASRPLPKVQELTQGSWGLDAHWYAESSMYPDNGGAFRFLNDFIITEVAKTSSSNLCSVASSAAGTCGTKKTTYQLADEMEADAQSALALINGISSQGDPDLEVKINNIKQQAYLSIHFAYKIRAATYKKANQLTSAREAMGVAYCWWMMYVNSMDAMYKGNKFRTVTISPDWHYADAWQLKDYTDLGGVGIPNCDLTKFTITLNANPQVGGSVKGDGKFYNGTNSAVIAIPNRNYRFVNWTENDVQLSDNDTFIIVVNQDRVLTANFLYMEPVPVSITTSVDGGIGGTISGGGTYSSSDSITITASPSTNFKFIKWVDEKGNQSITNPYSFITYENKHFTAWFSDRPCEYPWNTADFTIAGETWKTHTFTVDISCIIPRAELSMLVSGTSAMDTNDSIRISYKLDNGPEILLEQKNDVKTSFTVNKKGITGKVLTIIIKGKSDSPAEEIFSLSNLKVDKDLSCIDNLPWANSAINVNNQTITNQSLGVVNTSCSSSVTITADVEGVGGLDPADYCKVSYKVEGGSLQTLFDINNLAGAFAKKSFSKIVIAKSIELVLNAKNTFADETYKITNIKINSNPTSIDNIDLSNSEQNGIHIYPNPASCILNIGIPGAEISRDIKIFNTYGLLVHSLHTKNTSVQINIQSLNLKGIALVQVIDGKTVSNHKVLIN